MGEERKWEERKWRGKKMGEKMLSLIMLGWMRENRKEGKWVGEVGHGHWIMLCNFSLSYNPPILGGKTWEENGACGPPTFPLSPFISSPIFSLSKQGKILPLTPFFSLIFFPLPFSLHPSTP